MSEHPFVPMNERVAARAEAVYREHGMGPALRAAVKAAYDEVRPLNHEIDLESRDVINVLMAHGLVLVQEATRGGA